MKNKLLLLTAILLAGQAVHAQSLGTITGLRLYEHHSPSIAPSPGIPNASQSGYDFVNRTYVNSFDTATFGAHKDGTDTTMDMVEHNGRFGNNSLFGFTSGVSSIWFGSIKGNGTTKWMEAPSGFDYNAAADVNDLKSVYDATISLESVTAVKNNTVYIARIRNSELYVAVRCYNVTNGGSSNADTYFDFDYKYGVWTTTSIGNIQKITALSVYPNPAAGKLTVQNTLHRALTAKIMSVTGQEVRSLALNAGEVKTLDINGISKGLYLIVCTSEDGSSYMHKLVKQ